MIYATPIDSYLATTSSHSFRVFTSACNLAANKKAPLNFLLSSYNLQFRLVE